MYKPTLDILITERMSPKFCLENFREEMYFWLSKDKNLVQEDSADKLGPLGPLGVNIAADKMILEL